MDVKTISPTKASMSMGGFGKVIQELKQNHKISFELYELNKKEWNTNWVTDKYYTNSTPAVALVSQADRLKLDKFPLDASTVTKHLECIRSLIYGLRQAEADQEKQSEQKAKKTAMQKPVGGPPRLPTVNECRSPLVTSDDTGFANQSMVSLFPWRGLTDQPRGFELAIEHPKSKTLDTAIMGVKESSKQNGMTQNALQDNQDVWNVVDTTGGTVTVEEEVAGQFDGEGENEIADWDLCE
ncbi:MAG: hypothetical protein L6R42_005794 [Xanthoria sp. 1 TBL-2021]|nr:MAG: hypothetical protein L6R42_005794 [Xanthoria sp. 1 TBL-2021]